MSYVKLWTSPQLISTFSQSWIQTSDVTFATKEQHFVQWLGFISLGPLHCDQMCLHAFFSVTLYTAYYVLYYCNMVVWSWWDWSLIWTTVFILQCYDTVGWVIWPVKTAINSREIGCKDRPWNDYFEWDVKLFYPTQSSIAWCVFFGNIRTIMVLYRHWDQQPM